MGSALHAASAYYQVYSVGRPQSWELPNFPELACDHDFPYL